MAILAELIMSDLQTSPLLLLFLSSSPPPLLLLFLLLLLFPLLLLFLLSFSCQLFLTEGKNVTVNSQDLCKEDPIGYGAFATVFKAKMKRKGEEVSPD